MSRRVSSLRPVRSLPFQVGDVALYARRDTSDVRIGTPRRVRIVRVSRVRVLIVGTESQGRLLDDGVSPVFSERWVNAATLTPLVKVDGTS